MSPQHHEHQIGMLRERVASLETTRDHHSEQIKAHASWIGGLGQQVADLGHQINAMIHWQPSSGQPSRNVVLVKMLLSVLIPAVTFLLVFLLTGSMEAARTAARLTGAP